MWIDAKILYKVEQTVLGDEGVLGYFSMKFHGEWCGVEEINEQILCSQCEKMEITFSY